MRLSRKARRKETGIGSRITHKVSIFEAHEYQRIRRNVDLWSPSVETPTGLLERTICLGDMDSWPIP
jgi:hypothetical protein